MPQALPTRVNLRACRSAPEIHPGLFAALQTDLEQLSDHQVLDARPDHRPCGRMLAIAQAHQVAQQPSAGWDSNAIHTVLRKDRSERVS